MSVPDNEMIAGILPGKVIIFDSGKVATSILRTIALPWNSHVVIYGTKKGGATTDPALHSYLVSVLNLGWSTSL
jgi:hypothetical protein